MAWSMEVPVDLVPLWVYYMLHPDIHTYAGSQCIVSGQPGRVSARQGERLHGCSLRSVSRPSPLTAMNNLDIGYSNYGEMDLSEPGTTVGLDRIVLGGEALLSLPNGCPFEQVRGTAEMLPFRDASVDTVTVSHLIGELVSWDVGMAEVKRVLRPGGTVLARFRPVGGKYRELHIYKEQIL